MRESGYDALGAPDLAGALLYPALEPGRGPVGLVLVDHGALASHAETLLAQLLERHGAPAVLLSPAGVTPTTGPWLRVLHRPTTIADIVREVRELLPPPESDQPLS
ncbi:MAG TPA: hypothetical protein VFU40_06005 [Gemmatimonadales bacterium]|nr:hypothetical protein [Gemmatimonadales bacterium]